MTATLLLRLGTLGAVLATAAGQSAIVPDVSVVATDGINNGYTTYRVSVDFVANGRAILDV